MRYRHRLFQLIVVIVMLLIGIPILILARHWVE